MRVARRIDSKTQVEPVRVLGRGLGAQRGIHLTLRVLREATGKTQTEMAALTGIDQADISRLESRSKFDDSQVATLRRYVEALGGSLELTACFGDKRIMLVGVSDEGSNQPAPATGARLRRPRAKR